MDQPTRCGNTRNASIVSTQGRLAAAGRVQRRHRVIRRIPLFVLHSPGRTISGKWNEVKHAVQLRKLWIHRCVPPIVEHEPTSTNDQRLAKVTNDRPSAFLRVRTRPIGRLSQDEQDPRGTTRFVERGHERRRHDATPRHATRCDAMRCETIRNERRERKNDTHVVEEESGRPEPAGGRLKSPGGSSSPWTLPIERRW